MYFLGCKCGLEKTSRIVGGSEVNPVRLKYFIVEDKIFSSLGKQIPMDGGSC